MKYLDLLVRYLEHRCQINGVECIISPGEINMFFAAGVRNFAGVEVNDHGFPLFDKNPPLVDGKPAFHFLNNFIFWELIED